MTAKTKTYMRQQLRLYGLSFRNMRHKADLSQLELAHLAGVSQAIISHIECGYFLPSPELESTLYDLLAAE